MEIDIINDRDNNKFIASLNNEQAELAYEIVNGVMALPHTYVPPIFEGKGIASSLAKTALNYARSKKLKVLPLCSFISVYIERHPEYKDLILEK